MTTDNGREKTARNTALPDAAPTVTPTGTTDLQNYLFTIISQLMSFLGFGRHMQDSDFQAHLQTALEPQQLVRNPVFVAAQSEDIKNELNDNSHISDERAEAIVGMPENRDAALRAAINQGFERYTEDNQDVRYKFGAKDGLRAIDCSGFVKKALDQAADELGGNSCRAVFNANMATHSDGQIAAAERAGGKVLSGKEVTLTNLKEGMIIGLDTRDTGWDEGRKRGIDHIVLVYRDSETGQLMVGQSSSSGGGVNGKNAAEWLAANKNKHLYAVDMVPLVKQEYGPAPALAADKQMAASETPATVQQTSPAIVPGI